MICLNNLHPSIKYTFEKAKLTKDEKGNQKFEKYTSTAGRFLLANLLPKNSNIKQKVKPKNFNTKLTWRKIEK